MSPAETEEQTKRKNELLARARRELTRWKAVATVARDMPLPTAVVLTHTLVNTPNEQFDETKESEI